jgi:hypothetical protein
VLVPRCRIAVAAHHCRAAVSTVAIIVALLVSACDGSASLALLDGSLYRAPHTAARDSVADTTGWVARPAGSFRVFQSPVSSAMEWFFSAYDVIPVEGELPTLAWEFGDGGTGEGLEIVHIFAAPGLYPVEARSHDAAGRTRFIHQLLVAAHTGGGAATGGLMVNLVAAPTSGPAPLVVYFTAAAPGAPDATFFWELGNGRLASGASITQTYGAGQYDVMVYGVDSAERTGSATARIDVGAAPSDAPGH